MDRQELYTVNITGDEWQINRISAREGIEARKESRELEKSFGVENAGELIFRACALAKSIVFEGEKVFSSGIDVLEALTEQEIFELSSDITAKMIPETEYGKEKETALNAEDAESGKTILEKEIQTYGGRNTQDARRYTNFGTEISDREYGELYPNTRHYAPETYRDRVITLSRYLERDSRRYDG